MGLADTHKHVGLRNRSPSPRSSPGEHGGPRPEMHEVNRGTEPEGLDPAQSKSVTFDLAPEYNPGDRGYETDDSDSTVSGEESNHNRHHHHDHNHQEHHHERNRSPTPHPSTSRHGAAADSGSHGHDTTRSHHSRDHHNAHRDHHGRDQESVSDSDSTIDLPDRFDSKGRPLPQREEDPLGGHFEDIVKGISHVLF